MTRKARVSDEGPVREHHASEGITARILAALRAASGPDVPITPDTLAPIDHFHGKGVAATEELAALLQPKASDHLLDIGCGIGGPARWIAAKYGCHVTGVDLTAEFCEAARELNIITGLANRVQILHGDALSLPVSAESFDRAYSQAALMNVSDKRAAFREVFRALRPGGLLPYRWLAPAPQGSPTIHCLGPPRPPLASSPRRTRYGPICSQPVFRLSPCVTPLRRLLQPWPLF